LLKAIFFTTGSIKLRSYAGRSLFSGLLSAPAARKRAGVQEILHAFPESRFFLIGDSGEQDLELYAECDRSCHFSSIN
jgi:phosphatidate phosphatase APP1